VSLSHDIAGCPVSVIGLWAQSGIAVIVTMILEVVGCRSLGFGICRVLLSAAVVGCRLSALACRAQVVDCRVSSSFVAVGFWLSVVDCWVSVADCRCLLSPIFLLSVLSFVLAYIMYIMYIMSTGAAEKL
jgi:hypothetical protein